MSFVSTLLQNLPEELNTGVLKTIAVLAREPYLVSGAYCTRAKDGPPIFAVSDSHDL